MTPDELFLSVLTALVFLASYLLGSIPFGLLLTRLFGAGDIRKIGSGNIGATNVLRTGKKGLALATLLLDGGKGALAVLIAALFFSPELSHIAGFAAVMGHIYPVWLKFKGGKGVATAFGVLFLFDWRLGLAAGCVWLLVALFTRYSSLASILSLIAAPVFSYVWFGGPSLALWCALISLMSISRHRDNIRRLADGTETRIGRKNP